MIKKFSLKLIVFIVACLFSSMLSAQINTPSGAVVPFNSNPNYGANGIMPTNLPSGGTYGKSQDAADAYNEWKASYTESCGSGMIRVRFDDPAVTVSEGIAYGMQLAAYAADKALFDGLYKYWKNFQSPNTSGRAGKLMNWRVAGCSGVTGSGSAADADVDAAWALLIAETQWPTATNPYDYSSEAIAILQSARALDLFNNQLINGDGWGTSNSCRNPSYQSPAYYRVFQTVDNPTWAGAISGGYSLINSNISKSGASIGLVSDWSDPSGTRNTCNTAGSGAAPTDGYGYDACRNPWRMAQDVLWNNEPQAKAICSQIATYVAGKGAGAVGGPLYQNGGNYPGFQHNATFVSTFAMAIMGSTNQTLMNAMYTETKNVKETIRTSSSPSGYFGNTLRCVSLFMMTGNFWKYGTTSFQEINVRKATTSINILSGTEYDFQTQQIAASAPAGKLGTLTIENLGFATLNLTGTTKVVLSGTNAADFILTQPTLGSLALSQTTDFTVTFKPTTVGDKTATLTIANNDGDENPYIINLIGTGTLNATAPKMSVFDAETKTAVTNNGTVAMGTSSAGSIDVRQIGIVNTGDAVLNLNSVTVTGTGYTMVAIPVTPTTVAINDTGYVYVQVTSAAAGTPAGIITIASNDNNNPSFKINLTSNFVACAAAVTANEVYQDFNGNYKNTTIGYTVAGYTENVDNPFIDKNNPSTKVAELVRAGAGYQGPRYVFCGAGSVNLTNAKYMVSMLVYSPRVGVKIQMNLKTAADVANTTTYPSSSTATVTTTKANQWERVYFNHYTGIGKTGLANIEIYIDATTAPALPTAGTYYIDDIRLDVAPCISDLSGILQDFDTHNNTTLGYDVAFLSAPVSNPVSGGINTTPNVGQYTKNKTAPTYDDGFRYVACGNKLDLSTKKYISMLVYSPVANLPIQISAKIPDGADANPDPDDAASSTQSTIFANTWHRLYFDLSAVTATNLPNVFGVDIFFDPTDISTITGGAKIYFDDLRLETSLPCVTGIPATNILNDFENNRYLGVAFPGTSSGAAPYFNTIKSNTVSGGINTSTVISEFLRGIGATGTSVRFTTCQNQLDLTAGNNIIEMKVYSPNAGAAITMSLKNAAGTSIQDVTDTVKTANTWTTLRYDFTKSLNATTVAFIDVIPDPNALFSATGSSIASRTYYFDDIKYAAPSPEINIKALTTPTATDIPNFGSLALGTAVIGDSTASIDFNIQNNGSQGLTLTGPPYLVLGGANPADFVITTTPTFSPSISAFGGTAFTVMFKPKGTLAGPRSASLTIKSNDANEGTYVIYLNAVATAPLISVLNGGLTTSPVVVNNNSVAINVGSSAATTAAPAYTFSIKNTGNGPLSITSVLGSAGFVASALTPLSPIPAGALSTFTVIGTPALPGVNTGTITIKSTDPVTPTYVVNVTVTGSVPTLVVKDAALATVVTNNTAISMGSGAVGVNIAPTYTFTLTNSGTAPLTVTSILSSSTVFALSPLAPVSPIPAGGNATFVVTTKPSIAGANNGVITINSTDPTTPSFKLNVTATGTTGVINVKDNTLTTVVNNNPTAISMGTSLVGTAVNPIYTFTIANTGTGPLNIASITSSSTVFALSPAPVNPIAAGGTATFTVTTTPSATVANNTGVITINSNDATTPAFKVNVTVTATAPILNVFDGTTPVANNTGTAINVGTATVGTPAAPYTTFSIKNTGTGALTITSVAGSAGFAASLTPTLPSTIPVNGTLSFTVIATPALVGANTGTITILSNDATSPFVVKVASTGTATTPKLTVLDGTTPLTTTTPAINIGTAAVGSPTALYTSFSIKNTGTAPLTLTSITGSSPLLTVSAITPAPGSVPVNGVVTFKVSGTPTVAGANSGTITIATNDPTTPSFVINVVVTGTTVPTPAIKVLDGTTPLTSNGTAVSVGAAFVGSPAPAYTTFSVTNVGTGPLSLTSIVGSAGFPVSLITPAAPSTIAVNQTTTFTVIGTPTAVGSNAGTITITTNDPTTPIFTIKVTVTGNPLVPALKVLNGAAQLTSGSTPAINVGTAPIGVAATPFTTLSIQNTGNGALTFTSIAGSAGFAVVSTPAAPTSIAAGGTATITVTATPSAIGANPGTITITTNDPTTPSFVINVTATGVAASPIVEVFDNAMVSVPTNNSPAKSLGSVVVGNSSAPYTFTVKNTGNVALTGLAVATTSPGFVVGAPSSTTIAIGGSATFTVTGTPATATTINGVINITSANAAAYAVNVSVTGTSTPTGVVTIPGVTSGSTVDIGNAPVNSSTAPKTITITNTGSAPLTIGTITSSNPIFAVTQVSPSTIAPGASGTFTITATPTSTTPALGVITIPSNDPNSPFTFNVKSTGTAIPTGAILQVIDNANGDAIVTSNGAPILIGQNSLNVAVAQYKFTLKNVGTTPITITGLPASSGFSSSSISPSGPIAPGGTAIIMVSGTPNSASAPRVGSVTIQSNDANTPFILNVSVRVGVPTAVSSALTANAIDMYPNPTASSSSLEFNGNFEDVNVVVYTVDGKTVITQKLASVVSSETTKINGVDELPAGIYLVEVTTTQGKLVKRLIKQ